MKPAVWAAGPDVFNPYSHFTGWPNAGSLQGKKTSFLAKLREG